LSTKCSEFNAEWDRKKSKPKAQILAAFLGKTGKCQKNVNFLHYTPNLARRIDFCRGSREKLEVDDISYQLMVDIFGWINTISSAFLFHFLLEYPLLETS
jgi:hypothetical protein